MVFYRMLFTQNTKFHDTHHLPPLFIACVMANLRLKGLKLLCRGASEC